MVRLKGFLNGSVQRQLSVSLSLAILALAVVAGGFAFLSAFEEAHELQDDVLRQVAQLLDRQRLAAAPALSGGGNDDADDEARVLVQRLDVPHASSGSAAAGGAALALPATLPDGLQTLDIGRSTFRVLVRTTTLGERIAVAQDAGFRNDIARTGALRTVTPILILVPVLLLIVADLVRKLFRPISLLSREIDQRADQELHPVEVRQLPTEVRPFAVAINRLLARVGQAMAVQRRFVADAAHELRTPLTALSLQAERLAQADMSDPARERLQVLQQGIARGRALLDQLLTLARVQSPAALPAAAVSVQAVYRRVLEDLVPLAEARQIDIGVEGSEDAHLWVSEFDLTAMVRNLVDNAIRYTPAGGRVDLALRTTADHALLSVTDSGPGIAEAERQRVFDPFYRTLGSAQAGSGLGLSIVQTIAERIGAEVRLDFSDTAARSGLRVTVRIPLAAAARCGEVPA
ncbi:MAG: two-component sensor histidine kinase [Pseudomonadota bacterium]|nr:two-component sensor histidine kinase [Pseudomonadota bacterium]